MLINGSPATVSFSRPGFGTRAVHHFIFGGFFLLLVILIAAGIAGLSDRSGPAFAILAISAVLLVPFELARRGHLREIRGGRLEVIGDELRIQYPGSLKEPLSINLESVAVAAVEDTPAAEQLRHERGADEQVRFPVFGDSEGPLEDKVRGFLWAPGDFWSNGLPFPIRRLERVSSQPNLLLLFTSPVVVPEMRRGARTGPHGPMEKEALGALALRVDSPAEADALFRTHGVRSRIREDDLERLVAINQGELPPNEEALSYGEAQERGSVRVAWGVAASGLLLPFIQIWSLPLAWSVWNRGFKLHAIGIAVLACALLALDVFAVARGPEGVDAFRLLVGAGITVLVGVAGVWRGLAAGSQH